jgi:transposase InsO family protein
MVANSTSLAPTSPGSCTTPIAGCLSIRYSERLAANAIVASVGSKGDSYDNALAESFNGLYKWELIHRHGPWTGLGSRVRFHTAISKASIARSERSDREACHPTTKRENTSMMNAT